MSEIDRLQELYKTHPAVGDFELAEDKVRDLSTAIAKRVFHSYENLDLNGVIQASALIRNWPNV